MPELPEMEAWRRQLNDPVSAFPIVKAGPAHVATLKTFDPPLSALQGRRLSGAARRAKRLLFPTEDGELVLLVHLMTAGRLKYLQFGERGPKTPARLRFAFSVRTSFAPPTNSSANAGFAGPFSPAVRYYSRPAVMR